MSIHFCAKYKDMCKKMGDSIISPSDGDTSEEQEHIRIVGVSRGYTDYHQGRAIHMADSRIH